MHISPVEKKKMADSKMLDDYISAAAAGDMNAFECLYREVSGSVYAYALSVLKNTHNAEDVLQDCFMRIYRNAPAYRPNGKPMAWIMTITRNLCLDCISAQEKNQELSEEDWESVIGSTASRDDAMMIQACMSILKQDERKIIVLHAVSGFKHREIAKLLDMPLSTVLSKYTRAINKLRAYYEREE